MSKEIMEKRARGGASWADAMWRLSAESKAMCKGFSGELFTRRILCP